MLRYVVTYSNVYFQKIYFPTPRKITGNFDWEWGFKGKYKAICVFQGNAGRVENIKLLLEGCGYFILNKIISLCLG